MADNAHGSSWSDVEINRLADLYFSTPKPSIDAMAAALGRTKHAVWTEISRLGMAAPGAKMRTCRPCERPFFSWGSGNWICNRCKSSGLLRYAS